MKQFLSFLFLAACVYSTQAQTAVVNKTEVEIVNVSKEPVRLDNVVASCGCTTPEWPREAIQPGAAAPIKVGYNSATEGAFHKTVTIQFNNGQTKVIEISGNVFRSPATSAPVNSSITLLKQINQ
jgi:hypothetical protein